MMNTPMHRFKYTKLTSEQVDRKLPDPVKSPVRLPEEDEEIELRGPVVHEELLGLAHRASEVVLRMNDEQRGRDLPGVRDR